MRADVLSSCDALKTIQSVDTYARFHFKLPRLGVAHPLLNRFSLTKVSFTQLKEGKNAPVLGRSTDADMTGASRNLP